jgi:hypothetical protein
MATLAGGAQRPPRTSVAHPSTSAHAPPLLPLPDELSPPELESLSPPELESESAPDVFESDELPRFDDDDDYDDEEGGATWAPSNFLSAPSAYAGVATLPRSTTPANVRERARTVYG